MSESMPEHVAHELEFDAVVIGDAIQTAIDGLTLTGEVVGYIVWVRHPETGHAIAESRSTIPKYHFLQVVTEWVRFVRHAIATANRS